MQFEIAIRASKGARRGQEDTALAWPLPADRRDCQTQIELPPPDGAQVVAVLCDGMGGHVGGATASRTACEAFLPVAIAEHASVRARLYAALEDANLAIAQKISARPNLRGMGSTLVGVHVGDEGLAWVSVGDSPLYLWRGGQIVALNADHSLAPEIDKLAETGKISWADAEADPRRHYLRSALTGDEIEMIDLSEQAAPLRVGDVVLLASDGIHTLEESEIADVVGANAALGSLAIAERLIEAVDGCGDYHQDNTTIIAVRVLGDAAIRDGGGPLEWGDADV